MKENYTKGDCYALCEFLDALTMYNTEVINDIAEVLGYQGERIRDLLIRLSNDIDGIICDEQEQVDWTGQMTEIMKLKHIEPTKEQ